MARDQGPGRRHRAVVQTRWDRVQGRAGTAAATRAGGWTNDEVSDGRFLIRRAESARQNARGREATSRETRTATAGQDRLIASQPVRAAQASTPSEGSQR